jgi:hypothetical protein
MIAADADPLIEADEAIDAALSAADKTRLDQLLLGNFTFTGADGQTVARKAFLDALSAGERPTLSGRQLEGIGATGASVSRRVVYMATADAPLRAEDEVRTYLRAAGTSAWRLLSIVAGNVAVLPPPATHPPVPNPFPGSMVFDGSYRAIPQASASGMQSTYFGDVGIAMFPADYVKAMLPPRLSLANSHGITEHPVLLMIGRQTACSLFTGEVLQTFSGFYHEVIFIVPFVVLDDQPYWYNFVGRMYLDSQIAIIGGDALYGYQKERGAFVRINDGNGQMWSVTGQAGSDPLFWARTDPLAADQGTAARWQALAQILQMPLIGVWDPLPGDPFNATAITLGYKPHDFIVSYWEYSYPSVPPQELSMTFTILAQTPPLKEIASVNPLRASLAFRLDGVRWRLAYPPYPGAISAGSAGAGPS